jgi:hypothetical protein
MEKKNSVHGMTQVQKAESRVRKAAAKATSDKAAAKVTDGKKATAKDAAKAITESKKIIYLADGVTNGMIQKSLQDINRQHKQDAGTYMYCLKRWLHFAEMNNFFAQYKNITAPEIRTLPNLSDFRSDYEKKLFAKSGKYSVWLIGQLVKRYAAQKK